jgi:hypothetical protein
MNSTPTGDERIVKEKIERIYSSFANSQSDWHFFLGIADYVKYAVEHETTNELLKKIIKKRQQDFEEVIQLEEKAIKELNQSKEKILKIVKKHKLSNDVLDRKIEELKRYEEGEIESSRSRSDALKDYLFDISKNISESGHVELLQEFIDNNRQPQNIYGNFVFSKTIPKLYEEKEKLEQKKRVELWEAWNNLVLAFLVIYKRDEELERIKAKTKSFSLEAMNFLGLAGEMDKIRKYCEEEQRNALSTRDDLWTHYFKRGVYQRDVSRIHNYLFNELPDFLAEKERASATNKEIQINALKQALEKEEEQKRIKEELTKKITEEVLKIIQNRRTENTFYNYDSYSREGKLKIGSFPEISFKKTSADILQFFFANEKIGNEFKKYSDFNKFVDDGKGNSKLINSDDFSKRIAAINKRIEKWTKNLVKDIIQKGENNLQEANIYHWNKTIT